MTQQRRRGSGGQNRGANTTSFTPPYRSSQNAESSQEREDVPQSTKEAQSNSNVLDICNISTDRPTAVRTNRKETITFELARHSEQELVQNTNISTGVSGHHSLQRKPSLLSCSMKAGRRGRKTVPKKCKTVKVPLSSRLLATRTQAISNLSKISGMLTEHDLDKMDDGEGSEDGMGIFNLPPTQSTIHNERCPKTKKGSKEKMTDEQCTVYREVLSTIAHLHEEIKDIRMQYKLVFSTPHVFHRADLDSVLSQEE